VFGGGIVKLEKIATILGVATGAYFLYSEFKKSQGVVIDTSSLVLPAGSIPNPSFAAPVTPSVTPPALFNQLLSFGDKSINDLFAPDTSGLTPEQIRDARA